MLRSLPCVLIVFGVVAAASAQSDELRERARGHFQRGLEFFNEERHDAALAEFQRAYELVPSAEALYNLGRVNGALGNAVEAARAFERYLSEPEVTAARRREVQGRLERQRERIAKLWIETNVDGAVVSVDSIDRATTPMNEPLLLDAGSHAVTVRAPGHDENNLAVRLAGAEERRVRVDLRRVDSRGTLTISTNVDDVSISVDGDVVGRTPLASTVPLQAGVHRIVAERAGYEVEERELTIEPNAEAQLNLSLRRATTPAADDVGMLRLRLPDAPHVLRVDGETIATESGMASLPRGPHQVEISVADRQPHAQEITIPAGGTLDINFNLQWTPEVASQLQEKARAQRTAGIAVLASGAVLAGGSVGFFVWNENEIATTDRAIRELNEMCVPSCDAMLERMGLALEEDQGRQDIYRGLAIAGMVISGTLISIGLWRVLSADSDEEINEAASASLELGVSPGGMTLHGLF